MKHTGLRNFAYKATITAAWVAGAAGAFVGFINKVPIGVDAGTPILVQNLVEPIQDATWWFIPTAAAITSLCVVTIRIMGKPWMWEFIHDQINEFREEVFSQHAGEQHYKHQVTLFRCYRLYHALSLCNLINRFKRATTQPLLIPVARSGDMNQRTSSCFIVSSAGTHCEGVAGKIWASKTTQIVMNLPEIDSASDYTHIKSYAEMADVEEQWVRARLRSNKMLAKSLCGFAIRVKGRYWGVVVLDSIKPDGIVQDTVVSGYRKFGALLSKLLERV